MEKAQYITSLVYSTTHHFIKLKNYFRRIKFAPPANKLTNPATNIRIKYAKTSIIGKLKIPNHT
jgi:hypothetical protein